MEGYYLPPLLFSLFVGCFPQLHTHLQSSICHLRLVVSFLLQPFIQPSSLDCPFNRSVPRLQSPAPQALLSPVLGCLLGRKMQPATLLLSRSSFPGAWFRFPRRSTFVPRLPQPFDTFPPVTFAPFTNFSCLPPNFYLPSSISLGHPPSFLCLLCLLWPMNALDARPSSLDFPFSLPVFHLPRHRRML